MQRFATLFVSLALTGIGATAEGQQPQPVEAEEYAVYAAAVRLGYAHGGGPLVISSDGIPFDPGSELYHLRDLVRQGRLSSRAVVDYGFRNRGPYVLEAERLHIRNPFTLRATWECLEHRGREGWEAFQARCPELGGRVLVFSRVGFDAARTTAIVRVETFSSWFNEGHGSVLILVKRNGRWETSDLPLHFWIS